MMRALKLTAVCVGIILFAFPTGSDSCGIAPPVAVFATEHRPADVAEFARGKIGVIRPSYQRRYLIGAYRVLTGKPLSPTEAQALYQGPKPGPPSFSDLKWPDVRKQMGADRCSSELTGTSRTAVRLCRTRIASTTPSIPRSRLSKSAGRNGAPATRGCASGSLRKTRSSQIVPARMP